jgi:3-deoxy-D-manno-octulosonic-acid transferase
VFLGDTMGELTLFYAASDVAFVGGSLVPIGGHNLLEPAALGLPLVSGPHVFNAQEIAAMFIEKGACRIANDAEQLTDVVEDMLSDYDKAKERGELGRRILERNRGALQRLLAMIDPLLS